MNDSSFAAKVIGDDEVRSENSAEARLPKMERSRTKHARRKEHARRIKMKSAAKRKRREARKSEGKEPLIPKTIESCREKDETVTDDRVAEDVADEISRDADTDELSAHATDEYEPRVLVTFSENPIKASRKLALNLSQVIPNCTRIGRKGSSIKSLIDDAARKNFTDLVVINEDKFEPNGLLLIHLPAGPTANFRLTNVKCCSKKQTKELSRHRPEVILNNFNTRLGRTIGKMLAALFRYRADFKGRRVVTFHNQRDYIFFRHHRYKFLKGKPALRELGPRFTLKLLSLQRGTFDSKFGEYEWTTVGRRHQLESSRRKFFL